jgi:hypothetical protein
MKPIVANAADAKQVKHATRKEKDKRERERDELFALLKLPEFRRFAWRLMGFCGYGENPTHTRGDMTHQNIGRGDVARWLISEMGEANALEQWLLMQREAWHQERGEQVEAEAIRTPSAVERTEGTATSDAQ